jgi:hypothetical protein
MSDDLWDRVMADQSVGVSWPSPSLEVRRKILSPKHLQPTRFLRGPVPTPWLNAAADANPLALRVGLAIWYVSGCNGGKRTVTLNQASRDAMGLTPARVHRGLRALAAAGLVRIVTQRPGAHPIVELIDPDAKDLEPASEAVEPCTVIPNPTEPTQ